MNRQQVVAAAVVLFTLATSAVAQYQDATSAKEAAMQRYMRAVPMERMLEDAYAEIAKQLPQELRGAFVAEMRKNMRIEMLDRIARAALVKHFTADELNALADFYSSRHGASAMAKFGAYMGDVMPVITQEVTRAVQQQQAKGRN